MSVERRILLTSALGLFLELAWIRFLGSEIRIFAYFHNLLLLVCFLGLAYGLARAARPDGRAPRPVPLGLTLVLSALLVLVRVPRTALSLLSFLALPPGVWFGVALAPLGLVWALGLDGEGGPPARVRAGRAAVALASVLVVVLLSNRVRTSESETEVVWSPYQRLSFVP